MVRTFESLWKLDDEVSVSFPGNGVIKHAKVIKLAFTKSMEPLYDVEIPFTMDGVIVHTRLHAIQEWHLHQSPESMNEIEKRIEEEIDSLRPTESLTPGEYDRGVMHGLKLARNIIFEADPNPGGKMKKIKAYITFKEHSDVVDTGDSCIMELPNFKGYEPDYTGLNREHISQFYSRLADAQCDVVFDFEKP